MSEVNSSHPEQNTTAKPWIAYALTTVGAVLGLIIVAFAVYVAMSEICLWNAADGKSCMTRWEFLLRSEPNEIGDALAGFAGALAFVLLIVTVGLQSQELREQRKEIREQREATQEMAETQARQVRIAEQHEAGEHIEELLIELRRILSEELDRNQVLVWEYEVDPLKFPAQEDNAKVSMIKVGRGSSEPEFFSEVSDAILRTMVQLEYYEQQGRRISEPSGLYYRMASTHMTCLKIVMKERLASPAKKQRLRNLRFFELEREIVRFNSGPWWSDV